MKRIATNIIGEQLHIVCPKKKLSSDIYFYTCIYTCDKFVISMIKRK